MTRTARYGLALFLAVLGVYSAVLFVIELRYSQDHVRHYFSDIELGRPFFAVNTTISYGFLFASAMSFAFAARCAVAWARPSRATAFYISQCLIFFYLALDDRFLIHERLGSLLSIGDHWILLLVGTAELACLALLGGRELLSGRPARFLALGAALSALMLVFDALVPHDMVLRLSIEDISKVWAGVSFFAFSWACVERELERGP